MWGFEIIAHRSDATSEGWVERISHRLGCADIRLVLDDGTPACASLRDDELEWLGLGVGQIVHLRRLPSAGDPRVSLFRECLDLGG